MEEIYEEKNKRGWVRIVEAFVAILLIAGVLILIVSDRSSNDNLDSRIERIEKNMLDEIRYNDSLRNEIVSLSYGNLPLEFVDFEENNLEKVYSFINEKSTGEFGCSARICSLEDECGFEFEADKDVYGMSGIISATLESYSPKQIKIFCWDA